MQSRLRNKSAKILVIETHNTRRMMMTEYFRKEGWSGVGSAGSLKDAVAILESDPVPPDWIIAPLADASPVNGLQLLSLIVVQEKLRATRLSLVVEPGQEFVLPAAYAMGLLSHHQKYAETNLQVNSFLEVSVVGKSLEWDETQMSAAYLRRILQEMNRPEDLIALERRLLSLFPDRPECLIQLAEAYIFGGKKQDALVVLSRLKNLSPELEATVTALMENAAHFANQNSCALPAVAERLGINSAVIVDPDDAAAKLTETVLGDMGVASVTRFNDGQSAWEWLSQHSEPDLLIQEWRIPKVSGDLLVQRVRQHGFRSCSVIVFSSLVKSTDRMLLREMGVSDVIEKPQTSKKLVPMLATLLQQDRKPEDEKTLERKVRQALSGKDFSTARQLFEQLLTKPNTSEGLKKSLEAEFLLHGGQLKKAHQLAVEAVHFLGEDVFLLNLLGKIYHSMGQPKIAGQFFSRANDLSPQNIERLCRLAEVHVDAGDQLAARDVVDKARQLDSGNNQVLETDAKVSLAAGDIQRVKSIMNMNKAGDNSRLVAFMNNRAVSLVAAKQLTEASDLYRTALNALPEKMSHLAPIIRYNLALASIKSGNLEAAISHLTAAGRGKQNKSNSKVKSLLERASKARQKGETLILNTGGGPGHSAGPGSESESEAGEVLEVIEGLPMRPGCRSGDFCCHLVYQPAQAQALDVRVSAMLANAPRFKDRLSSIGYDRAAG